jgi:hypothetical protein
VDDVAALKESLGVTLPADDLAERAGERQRHGNDAETSERGAGDSLHSYQF